MVLIDTKSFMKQVKPVIGMVHLAGLPGSTHMQMPLDQVLCRAVEESRVLVEAGFDALLFQNTGDVPAPEEGDWSTVAYMTLIGQQIRAACPVPIGVNVLMNGSRAALAIASAIGAQFVRIKISIGAVVTSTGIVQGNPHDVLSFRNRIGAQSVSLWSDLYDRTSAPLGVFPLTVMADLAIRHAGADALVISDYDVAGCQERLRTLRKEFPSAYLVTGGGANIENLGEFMELSDAIIVGSSIKTGGHFLDPIDAGKAQAFMQAARTIRGG